MTSRERLEQFRVRFGLGGDTERFTRFRTRIVYAAGYSLGVLGDSKRIAVEREFAFRNGSKLHLSEQWDTAPWVSHGVIQELEKADSFGQLVECTQHLLWAFEDLGFFEDKQRYEEWERAGLLLANELARSIELSPPIDVRLQKTSGGFELAPVGVELLDETVDRVTQWLAIYPDVEKEFRQSLTILAEKKRPQYRQAQDSLRFALEKLLKIILSNNRRLEDQGRPLKEWLGERGINEGLRGVAVQIMVLLTKQYQNPVVKHDDEVASGAAKAWADHEVEYVVYQYATLFRLILEAAEAKGAS